MQVIVKIRPRSKRELNIKEQWTISDNSVECSAKSFKFDHIFGPTSSNSDVFNIIAPMVHLCKKGINATIFTYGQKSSGKTFTMMGNKDDPGVKTLAIRELFKENLSSPTRQFIIRVGYLEIFNENLYDLLNRRQALHINRHGDKDNIKLSNKEVIVMNEETLLKVLQKGYNAKTTKLHGESHCSHTIFQIIIESQEKIEGGTVQVSHLNLVDLDRSERAHIKNEQGMFVDKSLEFLCLAITALSNGEKFRNYCKSKLTCILKGSLTGNDNVAIICNISTLGLNETTHTLTFADEAKKIKTKPLCNNVDSGDTLINKMKADIVRLKDLRAELRTLLESETGKMDAEIADKESIFVMEKAKCLVEQNTMRVLKIRPFFASDWYAHKKYQIGEVEDRCMDAQSRMQRKSNALKWSEFYLERVGFEINTNMRHHLKYGKNVIGRSNQDVDICVDSEACSRKHCSITVSDYSSVSITDLYSSNGTMVNGVKYKGKTIELHEGNVISIVCGNNLSNLVGNFDSIVYRLCKSTTEKFQTYYVDDDDIIEICDDGDGASYLPVKMELEEMNFQPTIFVEMETYPGTASSSLRSYNTSDVASPAVQSEFRTIPKSVGGDDIIELSDDDGDATSYFPVKMELEEMNLQLEPEPTIFVEMETSPETALSSPRTDNLSVVAPSTVQSESIDIQEITSQSAMTNCSHEFTSIQKSVDGGGDFDLSQYILTDTLFADLDEIPITPLELDQLSNIQNDNVQLTEQLHQLHFNCENEKKLLANQIEIAQKETATLRAEVTGYVKEIDSLNVKLKTEIEEKASLQEKSLKHVEQLMTDFNGAQKEIVTMRTTLDEYVKEIGLLNVKLKQIEEDRATLEETNIKHINEMLRHFNKKRKLN